MRGPAGLRARGTGHPPGRLFLHLDKDFEIIAEITDPLLERPNLS